MELFFFLSVWIAFFGLSYAGQCPRYPLIKDFDFGKYLGMWYQQDKKQASWEVPGRCWKSMYYQDPKNGQFKMKMMFENSLTARHESYDSQLSLLGPRRPAVIKYTVPLTFFEKEFQVLATDYDTFAIEYRCEPNGLLEKQESIFLLTREKNPRTIILQKAYAIMHRYGIDIRKLERVDQTCGGIKVVPDPVPQESYSDYDYYSVPNQGLEEPIYDNYEQGNRDRFDYLPLPMNRGKNLAPIAVEKRRQPLIRRFKPMANPSPSKKLIQFGQKLSSKLKYYVGR